MDVTSSGSLDFTIPKVDGNRISYAPGTPSDWLGTQPGTVPEALDKLARGLRIAAAEEVLANDDTVVVDGNGQVVYAA